MAYDCNDFGAASLGSGISEIALTMIDVAKMCIELEMPYRPV
jgi:hypothetical protein